MTIEEYENANGVACVLITYEDGTVWSGLKSAWDEMLAAQVEHLTEIPNQEAQSL